ncbi:gibberellin 2-beta-dioxygenase 8 [Tanacetum coccineum]
MNKTIAKLQQEWAYFQGYQSWVSQEFVGEYAECTSESIQKPLYMKKRECVDCVLDFLAGITCGHPAWSNGTYKSVEHRVVANKHFERFSTAYFLMCPSYDTIIESCDEDSNL